MADYRTMFDNRWLRAFLLEGRDWTLTITKVEAGELEDNKTKRKERKPIVHFKGASKPLALNRTNAETIADMYGKDVKAWVGKTVTLYPTTTKFGRETVECIRIRPEAPKGKPETMPEPPPPPADERQPGMEG